MNDLGMAEHRCRADKLDKFLLAKISVRTDHLRFVRAMWLKEHRVHVELT
jgi:hypothetical protein